MLITDPNELQKYSAENRKWQGIPSVEITKNGRIFVCFYSGGETEQMGNFALLLESRDGGKTFQGPVAVADMGPDARAYDPCLWIDPLGRLWFIWSVMRDNRVEFTRCDKPDAETLVFSSVRELGYDVMLNKPIVSKRGEWLFPCAVWRDGLTAGDAGGNDGHPVGSHIFKSCDNGETFEKIGTAIATDRSYDEHMILEKKDGSLEMYIRTVFGVAVSNSTDGGEHWTKGVDCGFGGPNSRFHIRRLSSGNILLINHYRFSGRNNLTAMISRDDGKTYEGFLVLDDRNNVSYPDATEGNDGFIYIVYDRERGAKYKKNFDYSSFAKEILMAKVTEQDILEGKLVNVNSKLQVTVSKLGPEPQR